MPITPGVIKTKLELEASNAIAGVHLDDSSPHKFAMSLPKSACNARHRVVMSITWKQALSAASFCLAVEAQCATCTQCTGQQYLSCALDLQ